MDIENYILPIVGAGISIIGRIILNIHKSLPKKIKYGIIIIIIIIIIGIIVWLLLSCINTREILKKANEKYHSVATSFTNGRAWVELDGKYGFIDDKRGEIVGEMKYDTVWSFDEKLDGLALVKENGKSYYIMKSGGRWRYEEAYLCDEGLIPVMKQGKWGYINKKEKKIIPLQYDTAWSFNQHLDGLALVKSADNGWHYIKSDGTRWRYYYDEVSGFGEGFDKGFAEGFAPVKQVTIRVDSFYIDRRWGFIDKDKKEVIRCIYEEANFFSEGLAKVKLNGKYGFIGKNGNTVIPFNYEKASSFSEGLAKVKLNGEWFWIDKNDNKYKTEAEAKLSIARNKKIPILRIDTGNFRISN
jgi:hypothetical protein